MVATLLVGNRGFLDANLPLFLALPALMALIVRRSPQLPELLFAGAWSGGTWLTYALFSVNYSGYCCSIRWFVPLLAPAYYVLAVFLSRYPRYRLDFLVLSCWGAVLAALMWSKGPWEASIPYYWLVQVAALLSWMACWAYRRWRETINDEQTRKERRLGDSSHKPLNIN
jgi:hypothetical protein